MPRRRADAGRHSTWNRKHRSSREVCSECRATLSAGECLNRMCPSYGGDQILASARGRDEARKKIPAAAPRGT